MNNLKTRRIKLLVAFFLPLAIASLFRFWDIDLRPFHSDEGVNSFFLRNLYEKNYYHYDPTNYHGPFLYYIGLIPFYLFGLSDFSFRLMPVLFGIMVVMLLYPLRRRLGWVGLLTTGLLVAISPADSYFSRDTIHETFLVFFSLGIVVSFFLYAESKRSRYIYFATVCLAFTITVKETYSITFTVYIISLIFAYLLEWIILRVKRQAEVLESDEPTLITSDTFNSQSDTLNMPSSNQPSIFKAFFSNCWKHKYTIVVCFVMFLFINFLFYSSFFTYYKGVHGILTTLMVWTKTGTHSAGGHAKPFIYYFTILRKYELPLLVFGICGLYYAFRDRSKFTTFVAAWAVLIYLVYSVIPYKTPWLIINITIPLSILGGIFINGIYKIVKKSWHFALFYSIYTAIFVAFCYQSMVLNFINYDDDRYELVYVQTNRDIYNLIDTIDLLSDASGKDMVINVIAKSYWPLPWYLREYKNAKFWGKAISNPNAAVVLADINGINDLKKKLKGDYEAKRFGLRPGVWLMAYMQKGLYDSVFGGEMTSTTAKKSVVKIDDMDELEPGLVQRCYHNIECLGNPFRTNVENGPISFEYNNPSKKPYRAPFGIQWEGYLMIEKRGLYKFATKSDDGSRVYIDGDMVVDNGGFHALQYISNMVFLDEGLHHIKIDYFDGGGGAIMEFLWAPQGSTEELVPGKMLYHSAAKPEPKL